MPLSWAAFTAALMAVYCPEPSAATVIADLGPVDVVEAALDEIVDDATEEVAEEVDDVVPEGVEDEDERLVELDKDAEQLSVD